MDESSDDGSSDSGDEGTDPGDGSSDSGDDANPDGSENSTGDDGSPENPDEGTPGSDVPSEENPDQPSENPDDPAPSNDGDNPDGDNPDGDNPDGDSAEAPPDFEKGSPMEALYYFVVHLSKGKADEVVARISKRATGDLKAFRDGSLAEDKIVHYKEVLSKVRLAAEPRTLPTGTMIVLENEGGDKIQFTLVKENDQMVVSKMEVRKGLIRRPRNTEY
jgi:hypothetical protein